MCRISKRKWRVLCWNVRGLNADNRQREVRSKIEESDCDIICLQETKCESFDWRLLRKFCQKNTILLHMHLLKELLVVFWLYGIHQCLKVFWCNHRNLVS